MFDHEDLRAVLPRPHLKTELLEHLEDREHIATQAFQGDLQASGGELPVVADDSAALIERGYLTNLELAAAREELTVKTDEQAQDEHRGKARIAEATRKRWAAYRAAKAARAK